MNPIKTANPPSNGVASLCTFLPPGLSRKLTFLANFITNGVSEYTDSSDRAKTVRQT
jgi:hypothetical protein